jgi:hypothetical protein
MKEDQPATRGKDIDTNPQEQHRQENLGNDGKTDSKGRNYRFVSLWTVEAIESVHQDSPAKRTED